MVLLTHTHSLSLRVCRPEYHRCWAVYGQSCEHVSYVWVYIRTYVVDGIGLCYWVMRWDDDADVRGAGLRGKGNAPSLALGDCLNCMRNEPIGRQNETAIYTAGGPTNEHRTPVTYMEVA